MLFLTNKGELYEYGNIEYSNLGPNIKQYPIVPVKISSKVTSIRAFNKTSVIFKKDHVMTYGQYDYNIKRNNLENCIGLGFYKKNTYYLLFKDHKIDFKKIMRNPYDIHFNFK